MLRGIYGIFDPSWEINTMKSHKFSVTRENITLYGKGANLHGWAFQTAGYCVPRSADIFLLAGENVLKGPIKTPDLK